MESWNSMLSKMKYFPTKQNGMITIVKSKVPTYFELIISFLVYGNEFTKILALSLSSDWYVLITKTALQMIMTYATSMPAHK